MKPRILSGIQPSGVLHVGNYLGAIRQWVELQHTYDSFFFIVDLHAITVRQDPALLRENIRRAAATYIACGVDPAKAVLFVQSSVRAHAELAWVLNTFTQMGELERMTQFKDKSKQHKDNINVGLFDYPVLMAADILLYQTELVPVGNDQKQHVELTRNIAERMNNHYGNVLFNLPEPYFPKQGARIMGLDDPLKKMSKSAGSEWNYISLMDDADTVRKKFKKAVTDSGAEIRAAEDKPALTNLLTIYSLLSGKTIEELEKQYAGQGYGTFKMELAEVMVAWLTPIQEKINGLLSDPTALDVVLADGAEKASVIADQTLKDVYHTIGLGYR